jgi:two-component system OmpR family response regulator
MLPKLDGLSLVHRLRARAVETPAIFLTALGSVADRVEGLEGGADDYLVKPFSMVELDARLGAMVRRPVLGSPQATRLTFRDLALDRLERTVTRNGRVLDLLPLEFRLLEFLLLRKGDPVTRAMLLEQVWGFNFDPRTNIVETHISHLRGKLGSDTEASIITTVRGVGYVVGPRTGD